MPRFHFWRYNVKCGEIWSSFIWIIWIVTSWLDRVSQFFSNSRPRVVTLAAGTVSSRHLVLKVVLTQSFRDFVPLWKQIKLLHISPHLNLYLQKSNLGKHLYSDYFLGTFCFSEIDGWKLSGVQSKCQFDSRLWRSNIWLETKIHSFKPCFSVFFGRII